MTYIKKNKGFTLVELLAVMAILAILIIIAVPNVVKLFNNSKKNTFMTEAKIIYETAIKQNLLNTGEETIFSTGDLELSGDSNIEYSILTNKSGQVICYQVANDEYMWIYRNKGFALNNEEDIAREEELSPRDYDIILDCSGAQLFDSTIPATLAKGGSWWEGKTDKSTIERIIITYSYKSTDYDETFYSDEEKVGGLTTYVKDNVAYLVINRNKRKSKSISMPADSSNTFSGFTNLRNISGLKLLDFSKVTNMDNFFGKVENGTLVSSNKLSYINGYESFNTSNVKSAKNAFAGVKTSSIDLSNWNVHNLEDASGMFYGANVSLINLSGWDVRKINNYENMFAENSKIENISLAGWNTNGNATYTGMFNNCPNLISISADNGFKVNVIDEVMFKNDTKIVGSRGTTFINDKSLYARIDSSDKSGYMSLSTSNGVVSAKLYDTGTVSGSFTELTSKGSTPPDWNFYNGARLLEIKLFSMNKNSTKTLDISVPTGMYIVNDSWTKTGKDITNVSFTKLANQGTGSYSNNLTGTLKYTISQSSSSATIQLLVMFDTAIWDKNKKDAAAMGTDNMTLTAPIVVDYNNGSIVRKIENIHSAESVGRSSNGIGYSFYSYNNNSNIFIDNPTILLGSNFLLSYDQSSVPYFYKNVTYETYATFKNTDNETVRAEVQAGYLPSYLSSTGTGSSTSTLYKGEWNNIYASSSFSFPRPKYLVKASDNPQIGSNLTIYINATVTTYSGQTKTLSTTKNYIIKSTTLDMSDLVLSYGNKTVPEEEFYENSGYADVLGIFTMYNKGFQDINNVKVVYDYDTTRASGVTPLLKVMAARPFLEKDQSVNAKITLTNDSGQQFEVPNYTISSTNTTTGSYVSAHSVASKANLNGTYYLKKIEYTIPKISGVDRTTSSINYLYYSQASGSQSSGGNFMGIAVGQSTSKCSIYYDDQLLKSVTSTTYKTSTPYFSGNISQIKTPLGTEFTAGDKIELDINIASVSYPYTNTQVFKKPEVYLVLPFGINIDNVFIGNSSSVPIGEYESVVTKVKTVNIGDVLNNVYKITPNNKIWFGYLNITDTGAVGGQYTSKWFRVLLSTDISMEYTSFNLRDSVYFKDENGHISISGAYAQYSITDQYDVDNDNSTTDKFGTINNPNIQINIYSPDEEDNYDDND